MEREICTRCGGRMRHMGQGQLQLGRYGLLAGHLDHLFSGALTVDIYSCCKCKKIEFYALEPPEAAEEGGSMAKAPCPGCGQLHELDDPRCPHCGKRLLE